MRHAALLAFSALAGVAAARADPPTAKDRAAVEACLKRADPQVKARKAVPADCIGVVADKCQQQPAGGSTYGMIDCNRRELAVWEERLERFYRAALKAGGKEAAAVRRAERAFIELRDAKCALPSIQEAGGSIVGPLETACELDETARQALWLEGLDPGPAKAR